MSEEFINKTEFEELKSMFLELQTALITEQNKNDALLEKINALEEEKRETDLKLQQLNKAYMDAEQSGDNEVYIIPDPIVDIDECESLITLTEEYEKMLKPGLAKKAGDKVMEFVPDNFKSYYEDLKKGVQDANLYKKAMEVVVKGFKIIEEQAAKYSISENSIIEKIDEIVPDFTVRSLDEICFARQYDIKRLVNRQKAIQLAEAFVEGGVTGVPGFPGLPFNMVLSLFLYYRAVQSVALFYGYDVKNDPDELAIASAVFMNAMNPETSDSNEMTSVVGKIMLLTETTVVKDTAKKGWGAMATRNSITMFITQLRALANNAALKALEKAGKEGLEKSMFKDIFEQIGKRITLKSFDHSVPVVGAVLGALFDTAMMDKVVDYANIFYGKRFIAEKEDRIKEYTEQRLLNPVGQAEELMEIVDD